MRRARGLFDAGFRLAKQVLRRGQVLEFYGRSAPNALLIDWPFFAQLS